MPMLTTFLGHSKQREVLLLVEAKDCERRESHVFADCFETMIPDERLTGLRCRAAGYVDRRVLRLCLHHPLYWRNAGNYRH